VYWPICVYHIGKFADNRGNSLKTHASIVRVIAIAVSWYLLCVSSYIRCVRLGWRMLGYDCT
jgi:hypothetical protein